MSSRVDYVEDYLARYEWKYLLIKGNEPERRYQQSMIPLSKSLGVQPVGRAPVNAPTGSARTGRVSGTIRLSKDASASA